MGPLWLGPSNKASFSSLDVGCFDFVVPQKTVPFLEIKQTFIPCLPLSAMNDHANAREELAPTEFRPVTINWIAWIA